MDPWPHQIYADDETEKALQQYSRVLLTSPTGGGKTFIAASKIKRWRAADERVGLYTNRRQMVSQLSDMLTNYGIEHGIRASKRKENLDLPVQIASIQTEQARSRKAAKESAEYMLHNCDKILVDEAHLNAGDEALDLFERHRKEGAKILGLTATPLDMGHAYDHLIQAGTVSELRACGALLPALHFAPDEPDIQAFKRERKKLAKISFDGNLTEEQRIELMMTPTIMGRVHQHFERLNPEHEPTILFAPGVDQSLWFAQQFAKVGIKAAHMDGQKVWVSGEGEPTATSQTKRDKILARHENGEIIVLCNRFVLREGIDAPWLAHAIFATIFGSLQTYLQSAGRLLRNHSSLKWAGVVKIQDHGGNWWRWGSVNEDRHWKLEYTGQYLKDKRSDRLREKKDTEPFACPQCSLILMCGRCINCGWRPHLWVKARPVVSTAGTLRLMTGDIYKPHGICKRSDGAARWARYFWASWKHKKERTFRNTAIAFASEHNWQWPDPAWPFMPLEEEDWYRPCSEVPFERLVPKPVEVSNGAQSEGGLEWGAGEGGGAEAGGGYDEGGKDLFAEYGAAHEREAGEEGRDLSRESDPAPGASG